MKTCRYFKVLLLLACCFINVLRGMERSNDQKCIIGDINNGYQLNQSVIDGIKVGIFGVTPNYQLFLKYCTKALTQYRLALQCKMKRHKLTQCRISDLAPGKFGKKLGKFVGSSNDHAQQMEAVLLNILQNFQEAQEYNSEFFEVLISLFLSFGIDRQTLKINTSQVLQVAYANGMNCLIHIFTPIYFLGAMHRINQQAIYDFLQCAARYFQEIYQEIEIPEGMQVIILIPTVETFCMDIESLHDGTEEKNIAVVGQTIKREIFDHLAKNISCGFINQNFKENDILCDICSGNYGRSVGNIQCIGYDRFGRMTEKTFTPYFINKNDGVECNNDSDYEMEAKKLKLLSSDFHEYVVKHILKLGEQND